MIYGITGAASTGKTTLAMQVADAMSLTFVKTSITESARRHGFDPVAPMDLHDRIELQHHLLSDMDNLIAHCARPAILDRTPLDMIGYMLGEVHMTSHQVLSTAQMLRIEDYVKSCIQMTVERFDHVFFVTRLPFYEEADTRPGANPAYQLHEEMLMLGAINSIAGGLNYSIIRNTDLNIRISHLLEVISTRLDHFERLRASARFVN